LSQPTYKRRHKRVIPQKFTPLFVAEVSSQHSALTVTAYIHKLEEIVYLPRLNCVQIAEFLDKKKIQPLQPAHQLLRAAISPAGCEFIKQLLRRHRQCALAGIDGLKQNSRGQTAFTRCCRPDKYNRFTTLDEIQFRKPDSRGCSSTRRAPFPASCAAGIPSDRRGPACVCCANMDENIGRRLHSVLLSWECLQI